MSGRRTREIVPLILEVLRGRDPAEVCRGLALDASELSRLTAGFVDAGAAWVHEAADAHPWVQVNATLDPAEESPGASLVAGRLQSTVREALEKRTLDAFHFVFKPPGVRLRFLGAREALLPLLDDLLAGLLGDRAVGSHARGGYDAETYQFGGEEGLAAAHSFFTVESLAVLGFHRLRVRGEASMGAPEFSLTLLDLFLRSAVGDEWELWDLWSRMELTGRGLLLAGEARERALAVALATGGPLVERLRLCDAGLTWVPAAERAILLEYQRALPPITERVRGLHERGALLFPLREILPFWNIFHFNRMCFSDGDQRFLSFLMRTLLSPKESPTAASTAT